jgi:hypothetical protein
MKSRCLAGLRQNKARYGDHNIHKTYCKGAYKIESNLTWGGESPLADRNTWAWKPLSKWMGMMPVKGGSATHRDMWTKQHRYANDKK